MIRIKFEIMRNIIITGLFLLLCAHNLKVRSKTLEEDITNDSEVEVLDEETDRNDDGVFKPTHEWQKVGKDQSIPRGLHVRLNLQTGEREAKLMDDSEQTELTNVATKEELSRDELQEALKNIPGDEGITPEDIERVRKNFRPYETLKKELQELELNVKTDLELMNELLVKFKSGDDGEKLSSLTDLEYLVHQFDNAREFVRAGGLTDVILPSLNSSSSLIRAEAIRLLGSASQSNSAVQIAALENGNVAAVLRVLALDRDATVRSRAVYALSCLVRRFPTALLKLVTDGGLGVFATLFQSESQDDLKLQIKVITLLHDLVLEIKETEEAYERNPENSELLEKRRQYSIVKLTHHLVNEGWCERLPRLLQASPTERMERRDDLSSAVTQERPVRPEHDLVEKVVTAMLALVDDCKDRFRDARPVLSGLEKWYKELASREELDRKSRNESEGHYYYYTGLAQQVASLTSQLDSQKDEL